MLPRVRTVALARVAAVLVAAATSGAPRVLAMHAPVEGHRCSCRAHGAGRQLCECARCRSATNGAERATDKVPAPRCHPSAERRATESERSRSGDAPCVEGTCGAVAQLGTVTASGTEPFCLPATNGARLTERVEMRPVAGEDARVEPLEPETPPPRAA